jgi:cystathionine beta-lyase/cystathionine gamma-synthase
MNLSYILNELGEEREHYFNAIAPPIIQTSNFAYDKVSDMRKAMENEYNAFLYSRGNNPTVDMLCKKLAALDDAEDCLVFNSGAAAIFAAVFANVKCGDHIVSVKDPYSWAQKLFSNLLPRFGITTTFIDGRYIENFERAILPNTTVIYLESPNSWDYALQDLKAVAELAKAENIVTICDNSYCTPIYQQPIKYGIDICVQSATKYISGHSDTIAGVLTGSHDMMKRIFNSEYMSVGSGIQPFNAWLLIRGLRTLPLRLERTSASTKVLVNYLNNHPKIEEVIFPFDEKFSQYELAKRQMNGACGLLSFIIKDAGMVQIEKFCESLEHILLAVSWGGHESLIIPKIVGIDPASFDINNRQHRMLRLYVGLEDPAYLIADIEQAFAKM